MKDQTNRTLLVVEVTNRTTVQAVLLILAVMNFL